MSVISNTTVLSNFASIGQLDLLHRLYEVLYISLRYTRRSTQDLRKVTPSTRTSPGWFIPSTNWAGCTLPR